MKKNRVLIPILISCFLLLPCNYTIADYESKQDELIRNVSESNPDPQKVQELIPEIPAYNPSSQFINISLEEERAIDYLSLDQTAPYSRSDYAYPDPYADYPVTGYNSATNNPTAIEFRNQNRSKRQDFATLDGRQGYYCGTVEMPLDEIYSRLNNSDYRLQTNVAYKDSGEIGSAKQYFNFKNLNLLSALGLTPTLCAANPILGLVAIYLALPERQKHVRIFATEQEGVYEIRAHDEPSIFHPFQHLHYTASSVSDDYDNMKEIFPEMEGEPNKGSWSTEGKIMLKLKEIGSKIKGLFS